MSRVQMGTQENTNNIKLLTERLLSVEKKIEQLTTINDSNKEKLIFENAQKDTSKDGTGGNRVKKHQTSKQDIEEGQLEVTSENAFTKKKENREEKDTEEDIEQKINEERKNYAEGLTIHGANRIAAGKPLNRAIWSILVLSSFLVAILISKDHFQTYLSHKSRTNIEIVHKHAIDYPAITICSYESLRREAQYFGSGEPVYPKPQLFDYDIDECGYNLTSCGYNGSALVRILYYTSDYFEKDFLNNYTTFDNTTNCFTVSGYSQTIPAYILSMKIVANQTKDHYWTEIYINQKDETFQEATPTVYWASSGFYHAAIKKRIITRLGLPYTDCVEGRGSYAQNKFVGNYTITKCKKGCFWEKVFQKCGAIPQMYKKHTKYYVRCS